jgi:hypothetical protein
LRTKRIQEISISKFEGGQVIPSYNHNSCEFFDELNKKFGWNGIFAKNKGEFHIKKLGYFVDYYEPNLNLVIEWDERNHYDIEGNLKNEDLNRENEIKEHLKCKFVRIKEWEFEKELYYKKIYENINVH